MYLSHYKLKEKPFQISTDPKFIWLGECHKEALAVLEYGVLSNMGFLLVTGDAGTGKTTLVNALIERLGNDTIVANITNPALEKLDFLNIIADEFNINKQFPSKGAFLTHFNHFLNNCYLQKKRVLLIIDEAHRLDQELLEQIRLLSNIEKQDMKLLSTFFIGQDEFNDIITGTKNRALRQRIAINFHLEPLKETEIEEYILHRLRVAGNKRNFFSASAISEIFSFSKGYPRLINIICDHALLTGYVIDTKTINARIIKECATGFLLPVERIDDHKKEQATLIEITDLEKPPIKSSGKQVKAIVFSVLSLIILSILFYFGVVRKHIANINEYFKQAFNLPTNLTLISVPQIDNLNKKISPSVQSPQKTAKTSIALTPPVSKYTDSSGQEENGVIVTPESYKIPDSNSSEARDQNDHLRKIDKLRQVWELPSIPLPKSIINFSHNSNYLSDRDFETLKQIGSFISRHPNAKIIIKGYADSYGEYMYNKNLSKLRANLVKSYFVGQGISPSRIKTFGMGSENPRRSNKTLAGRMLNRRVEIKININ